MNIHNYEEYAKLIKGSKNRRLFRRLCRLIEASPAEVQDVRKWISHANSLAQEPGYIRLFFNLDGIYYQAKFGRNWESIGTYIIRPAHYGWQPEYTNLSTLIKLVRPFAEKCNRVHYRLSLDLHAI